MVVFRVVVNGVVVVVAGVVMVVDVVVVVVVVVVGIGHESKEAQVCVTSLT